MPDPWDEADDVIGRVERQARRDQVEGEAEAERLRLMKRSLTDLAWEAMQHGHRVRLTWQNGSLQGVPESAIEDLVVFPMDERTVGVNLVVVSTLEVIERRATAGSPGDRTLGSFLAFCRMVEGNSVTCELVSGRRIDGTLLATATDHLYMRTAGGVEVAAARDQVAAISVAGDFHFPL